MDPKQFGNNERIPIWLDCDPGHDDAFAILLASTSPTLKLLGISIVHGNDTVENCAKNALRMLWAYGIHGIPVYTGIHRPLIREPKYCPEIHGIPGEQGVAGMCGYHFPDAAIFNSNSSYHINPTPAVIAMSSAVLSSPKKVTIILTGAHTNFAIALRLFPQMKSKIEQVIFMGGAIGLGNTGIAAEFNIQIDPEAAAITFHSGLPLVMIPLEVTHQVLVHPPILKLLANIDNESIQLSAAAPTPDALPIPHRHHEYKEIFKSVERFNQMPLPDQPNSIDIIPPKFSSPFAECCHQLLTFFQGTYSKEFGFQSPPLHDPCTIFYLTNPKAFHTIPLYVDVETGSEKCLGRTLCDINNLQKKPQNILVCTDIDTSSFWQNMLLRIHQVSKNSPLNKLN